MYDPTNDSYCQSHGDVMHDWILLEDHTVATVEYCSRCKTKEVFYKADNNRYLKTHKRDFLQPNGATRHLFAREYGTPNYGGKQDQGKAKDGVKDLEI